MSAANPPVWKRAWHRLIDWFAPWDVFISYSTVDGNGCIYARGLKEDLPAYCLRPKMRIQLDLDDYVCGDELKYATRRALNRCQYICIVVRPGAMASVWVREEITTARKQHKHFLVVDIDRWYSRPLQACAAVAKALPPPPERPPHWADDATLNQHISSFGELIWDSELRLDDIDPASGALIRDSTPSRHVLERLSRALDRVHSEWVALRRVLGSLTVGVAIVGLVTLFFGALADTGSLIANKDGRALAVLQRSIENDWRRPLLALMIRLSRSTDPIVVSASASTPLDAMDRGDRDRTVVVESARRGYLDWKASFKSMPWSLLASKRSALCSLRYDRDPIVRRYLIADLAENAPNDLDLSEQLLAMLKRHQPSEDGITQALILVLGYRPFDNEHLQGALEEAYKSHPDGGVHSAIRWTLDRWELSEERQKIDEDLVRAHPIQSVLDRIAKGEGPRWFPLEISPKGAKAQSNQRPRRFIATFVVPRNLGGTAFFAVATTEVTWGQWRSRMPTSPTNPWYATVSWLNGHPELDDIPAVQTSPQCILAFCGRISKERNVRLRLPTGSEWYELAFRRETRSNWPSYVWTPTVFHFEQVKGKADVRGRLDSNDRVVPYPVARALPNDDGLFDIIGNVAEVCSHEGTHYSFGTAVGDPPAEDGTPVWRSQLDIGDKGVRDGTGFRLIVDLQSQREPKPGEHK